MTARSDDRVGARGAESMTDVLARLDDEGYSGQYQTSMDATIRCLTCRRLFPASASADHSSTRLEGASDPAEMSMVVPLVCPHCSTRGALILRYGPEASADEADVFDALDLRAGR